MMTREEAALHLHLTLVRFRNHPDRRIELTAPESLSADFKQLKRRLAILRVIEYHFDQVDKASEKFMGLVQGDGQIRCLKQIDRPRKSPTE